MEDKNIGEKHGAIKILCRAAKPSNGYLHYYWCKCDCGNIKRYRYDQARRAGDCGMCEDFRSSKVLNALKEVENG